MRETQGNIKAVYKHKRGAQHGTDWWSTEAGDTREEATKQDLVKWNKENAH